jgi:hypothetical protein
MAITHVNRRGQTYYLHQGTRKTGKAHYYFSMKNKGPLAETIPDGYEIYEKPNGQVFLRKKTPKVIADAEVAVVEAAARRAVPRDQPLVEVEKNSIVIHLPHQSRADWEQFAEKMSPFGRLGLDKMIGQLQRLDSYHPEMRFILVNEETRAFRAERWCYRGSIDGWWPLSGNAPLAELVARYCPHLGKESFFDLI